jgi:hypothetical protein
MQADDRRAHRERRKTALGWLPYGVMAVLIVAVVAGAIGFSQSWWVSAKPRASAQQEYRNQSIFDQAGIDYSGRTEKVKISLAKDRPFASKLGLPASGTTAVTYIVPLTITFSADGSPIRQSAADKLELRTANGKIAAVLFVDSSSYPAIHQRALDLLTATGGEADASAFDAALISSRAASGDASYDAVGTTTKAGIVSRVELKGTPSTTRLTMVLTPAS